MSDATTAAAPAASPAPDTATAAPAAAPAPAATLVDSATAAASAAAPAPAAAPGAAPAAAPPATDSNAEAAKGGEKPEGEKPAGAPEKYADFTFPEGAKVDEARMGKFTEWAKANNLPQDAAQAALDMAVDLQKGNVEQLQAAIQATAKEWHTASLGDKEFGGDRYDESLGVAKRALDQFGTPELKAFLKESNAQMHPEVLRFMYRVGQAISQDGFVPGRQGAGRDPAKTLFPSMN